MDEQEHQELGDNDQLSEKFAKAVVTLRDHYISDTKDLTVGKQKKRQRKGLVALSIQALEGELVDVLQSVIDFRQYKVQASAGQPDRSFVMIPYAMLLRRDVTTTPQRGVYIALLFQQDIKALWLTLNQGVQQFEKRFGLLRARDYLSRASQSIAHSIGVPAGFVTGSINLAATTPYGKGYEEGSICGKCYALDRFGGQQGQEFLCDLKSLIDLYNALPAYAIKDPSIAVTELDADDDEAVYQEKANSKPMGKPILPVRDVPLPRPSERIGTGNQTAWVRDAQVAIVALQQAGYRCEADCNYGLFRAAAADHSYVEAHHLIPLSRQEKFEFSLDVPANVISLCPSCHAKVHRGHKSARIPLILELYQRRVKRLQDSGLDVSAHRLLAMY